jgi:hypothetical protein
MKELTGKRYGRWMVRRFAEISKHREAIWVCACDCGTERNIRGSHLISGHSKSCACGRTQHGFNKLSGAHPIYKVWGSMKARCSNPNSKDYKNYGGRGITVCERWMFFPNFRDDMFGGWKHGLTIDRINNDGNYEPGNCRWATRAEQNRNKQQKAKPCE